MESIDPRINELLTAYCAAAGVEMELNIAFERWLSNAAQMGVTPDKMRLCIVSRLKQNRVASDKRFHRRIELHKLVRDEEDIAVLLSEAAVEEASLRVRSFNPGKASVLRATGRPDAPPEQPARSGREVVLNLADQMRKAASA